MFAPILAPIRVCTYPCLANQLINLTGRLTSFPDTSHHPAGPRLKKPGLDPSGPANYRPISNLSFISKLIERVVHRQLSTFVETNQLLPPTQSGFRSFPPFYRDSCLKSLQRHCYSSWRQPHHSSISPGFQRCVRLRRSFHSSIQVLEVQFGITASALNWIAFFLTGRHSLYPHFTFCKLIFHPSYISIEIQTCTYLATSEKAWLTEVWALRLPAYFKFKHHWQDFGASGPSSSISSHFHISQFLPFAVCLSQISLHWDRSAQAHHCHQWYHGDYWLW